MSIDPSGGPAAALRQEGHRQPAQQPPAKPKLLDRVREAIRMRHYSPRTEKAYVHWIRRYIFFHKIRHPADMGKPEINAFLSHLAVKERVSASTQTQALSALVFLYRHVLERDIGALEGLHIRVKDIDFERNEITVRDGKGQKDRVTMLPASCKQPLLDHLQKVGQLHENGLRQGLGRAPLPDALARKYPSADRQWAWQYVFPASSHFTDRQTGVRHRHHLHETVVQKAMAEAVRLAGLNKPATPHTLRHYAGSRIMPSKWLGAARRLGSELRNPA